MRLAVRRQALLAGVCVLVALASSAVPVHAAEQAPSDGVIGGTTTALGEFPMAVGLLNADESSNFYAQFCGGSLISSTRVLTAAHCVRGRSAGSIDVLVGTNHLGGSGTRIAASRIHVHPGWSTTTNDNDLAAIDLAEPVSPPHVAAVQPVRPAESSIWAAGRSVTTVGWGLTGPGGAYPLGQRKVTVPVVSGTFCGSNRSYGSAFHSSTMLCAGAVYGGYDSCQGDSGGPLLARNGTQWRLVGIVSWGNGCALPFFPGIYTRLASYSTPNDGFFGPTALPGAGGTARSKTFLTTRQAGEPQHAGGSGGASVWYSWRAPASGPVQVTTFGSTFDTLLGVYEGSQVSSLSTVGSNNDASGTTRQSRVTFNAVGGHLYRIAVDGRNGVFGTAQVTVRRL